MIKCKNGGIVLQPGDELPSFRGVKKLYLDYETTSGSPDLDSLDPWHNCYIAGVAVAAETSSVYYAPIDCRDSRWNCDHGRVLAWLEDLFTRVDQQDGEWVNHNVKYDMLVSHQNGLPVPRRVSCTLVRAKLLDSDRKFKGGYGLDALARDWLDSDITHLDAAVQAHLRGCKSKDYGDVPGDIVGEYACQDVMTTRSLDEYLERRMPEQCRRVEQTEKLLTPVMFDVEVGGMRVDPTALAIEELKYTARLLDAEERLQQLTGQSVRPHVNEDCFKLLCGTHGLPVLSWTDKQEPSFDKHALASYAKMERVLANAQLSEAVKTMRWYRKVNTLLSLFIRPYQSLHVDGVLHPQFNQSVSTGRMSCGKPNMQQLSDDAKQLVYPKAGHEFLSADYSQIEFRLIVHLIQNAGAIAAYLANPDTDFHQWVADISGMLRDPAKNLNFAMAFGAGENKARRMLETNPTVYAEVASTVDAMLAAKRIASAKRAEAIEYFVSRRAKEVYDKYHASLPELKRTQREAEIRLKQRGYVFNLYGRHRHLPTSHAFAAFNSVIQSSAADLMKERLVAIAPRYSRESRELGLDVSCVVHDEFLFSVPLGVLDDPRACSHVAAVMESPAIELRIPIRASMGRSAASWYETKNGPVKPARAK